MLLKTKRMGLMNFHMRVYVNLMNLETMKNLSEIQVLILLYIVFSFLKLKQKVMKNC